MFQQSVAWATLLLSLCLWIYSLWPAVNRSFPLALGMELWPYLCLIPAMGLAIRLYSRRLRRQRIGLGLATLMLLIITAPWCHWLGLPSWGPHSQGLKVMSYNMWAYNKDYKAIQQSIQQENPDILFLTEILQPTMLQLVSRLDYPFQHLSAQGNHAFFSRYPLLQVTAAYPNITDHGLNFSLIAHIETPQGLLTAIGFHPPIPLSRSSFTVRNQQFERIAPFIHQIPTRVIFMGDFNTSPWSPYFAQLLKASNLSSSTQGQGIWATWNYQTTFPHLFAKLPIDHIATRGFDCVDAWTGDANGSDHRSIIAVLKPT